MSYIGRLRRALHRLSRTLGNLLSLNHGLRGTLHGLGLTLRHLLPLGHRLGLSLHGTCRALIHGSSYIFGSGHTLRRRLISGEMGNFRPLSLTFKGSLMLYSPYDCRIR